MIYYGCSNKLEKQVIKVPLVANPLVKVYLVADLVVKLRDVVALDADEAAALRGALEPDNASSLIAVYGRDGGTEQLQVWLRISDDAYGAGLPSRYRDNVDESYRVCEALEAVSLSRGISTQVDEVSCCLDSSVHPAIAITCEEARDRIIHLRAQADALEQQLPSGLTADTLNPGTDIAQRGG